MLAARSRHVGVDDLRTAGGWGRGGDGGRGRGRESAVRSPGRTARFYAHAGNKHMHAQVSSRHVKEFL